MDRSTRPFSVAAVGLGCWLASAVSALADAPLAFEVQGLKSFTTAADDPAVVRRQPAAVRSEVLDALAGAGERLAVGVFGGRRLQLEVERLGPTAHGRSLEARVVGEGDGTVVMVWGDGHVFGTVTLADAVYRLRDSPDGHVLEAVDLSAYPRRPNDAVEVAPEELSAVGEASSSFKDSGAILDLMVVYTPAARVGAGGATAIRQLINLGVVETNRAFADSRVGTRLRLVHLQEVPYAEGGADIGRHLSRLRASSAGLGQVRALRDQYGADLVKLVGNSLQGGCGIAYLMAGSNNRGFESSAYSYTARQCISPNYTFAHELGHNLGSNHAPVDPVGNGAYPFSFGYKDPGVFRTIMAYTCDDDPCIRRLRWSNPRLSFAGRPQGTPGQDNARSINGIRGIVANFRQERRDPGALGLTVGAVDVGEADGEVRLTVRRSGGTAGAVGVSWATAGTGAEPDVDFGAAAGSLSWGDGDGGERTLVVPLFDDAEAEGTETFEVRLSGATGGAGLGTATAQVRIADDDVDPFTCADGEDVLCLADGRFEVRVTWTNADGDSGAGRRVPADGGDSGLVWFFDPANWELLVKVLDGCALNGHHWVLFAGTTNVGYSLRVTDTVAGRFKEYRNPVGEAAPARTDVEAFATCP